jgi:type III secretory pathway component EscS
MEFLKTILFCIVAAICYGIVHDQITARVCIEYFTIGHPPVFNTNSPTLLGLGWGVIATWWVGLFLGIPLALVARCGARSKLTTRQIAPMILKLLCVMAILALTAGILGYLLASHGTIRMTEDIAVAIPPGHRVPFIADWFAHLASYLVGFAGGIVVIIRSGLLRRKLLGAEPINQEPFPSRS